MTKTKKNNPTPIEAPTEVTLPAAEEEEATVATEEQPASEEAEPLEVVPEPEPEPEAAVIPRDLRRRSRFD